MARIQRGAPFLSLPATLTDITTAVGKFHLEAHVADCHIPYSTNYILGAGQVDGEILETIWSEVDKLAPSTRAMSPSHRHETLDRYMNFLNFEKTVKLGKLSHIVVDHKPHPYINNSTKSCTKTPQCH